MMKFREKQKRRQVLSEETLKLLSEECQKTQEIQKDHERFLSDCVAKLENQEKNLVNMRYSQKMSVVKMNEHFGETGKKVYRALERIRFKLYACIDNQLESEGLK